MALSLEYIEKDDVIIVHGENWADAAYHVNKVSDLLMRHFGFNTDQADMIVVITISTGEVYFPNLKIRKSLENQVADYISENDWHCSSNMVKNIIDMVRNHPS